MEPKDQEKKDLLEAQFNKPAKPAKTSGEEPLPLVINDGDQQTNLNQASNGHEQYGTFAGTITFENILHAIGHNGRFQLLLLITVILTNAIVDLQNVHTVFTLTTPKHRSVIRKLLGNFFATEIKNCHLKFINLFTILLDGNNP